MGYQSVAETTGLKTKEVKCTVEAIMGVAAEELKKTGSFKFAGMLSMKLKKKPSTPARKGVRCEPFHQGALCVQGEARLKDCEGPCHEAQGSHQLRAELPCATELALCRSCKQGCHESWWSVSPGS